MKVSIELALRTREVYQLFERKISGDRLFIEAILYKMNVVINRCRKQSIHALACYQQMEQQLIGITHDFNDEITRFESLLAKKKEFSKTTISFVIKYRPLLIVTNPLAMELQEFIETYDKLIAVLRLLHLAGCFESDAVFWGNVKRYQTMANQMLSGLITQSRTLIS